MTRGRSIERGSSGSQNHVKSKSKSKKNIKCYNCGKKWHVKKDGWNLKNDKDVLQVLLKKVAYFTVK